MKMTALLTTILGLGLVSTPIFADTIGRDIHCAALEPSSAVSNTSALFQEEVYTGRVAKTAATKAGYWFEFGGATCYQMDGTDNTGFRYDVVLLTRGFALSWRDLDPLQYFMTPTHIRITGERTSLDSAKGVTFTGTATLLVNSDQNVQGAIASPRVGSEDNVMLIVRPRSQTAANVAEGARRMSLPPSERTTEDLQMGKDYYQRARDNYPEFERMLIWENSHAVRSL